MSGAHSGARFWLRWSWRDIRGHWVAVVAIALVLAIGTGVYAGLSSTNTWRRLSNDASFAALEMHDLRASANPGTFTTDGAFAEAVAGIDHAGSISNVTERLVLDSQVEVETDDGLQVVNARIVGGTLHDDSVDRVWIRDGVAPLPRSGDAVLEAKFADFHGLEPAGALGLADGRTLGYTGLGVAPEDFYVISAEGSVLAEADLATIYVDLTTAQELAGRPGAVNDVVIALVDGADRDVVERELDQAASTMATIGVTVSNQDEDEAFRILYEDIDNDQQFFTALSVLILFAAALAAFNLVSRIVEAQRREIGIGMAIGAPHWQLALRPLLVGVQIAILGVVAGIGVGVLVGEAMRGLLESLLPMPDYRTPFQFDVFTGAAALGFAIPVLASAWPVWRAIRVEPIDAIRTGHLTARPGRFTTLSRKVKLPGSSLNQIPLRNVLRTPRRTLLTAVGVGAAIAALVAVLGMLDSFSQAIDRGSAEVTRGDPDRVLVQLETFVPLDAPELAGLAGLSQVGGYDAGIRLPATMLAEDGEERFDVVVDAFDFSTARWTPTVDDGGEDVASAEIVIAEKAAGDLGVGPGDRVTVRHPAMASSGFGLVETDFVVAGLHPNPIRSFVFVDTSTADPFGLGGTTNFLYAYPADDVSRTEMRAALFANAGVASTQPVARIGEAFDEALEAFVGFLVITATAVLVLAILIAFNATRITVDERRRDHATMRAYGLPVRSVIAVLVKESVIVGLLATLVGLAAGTVLLGWMLRSLMARTLPDFGIGIHIAPQTFAIAIAIGVAAVAVAPLFLIHRVRSMDIPSALRVME